MRFFKSITTEFKENNKKVLKLYLADKLLVLLVTCLFCAYSIFGYSILNIIFIVFAIISVFFHFLFSKKAILQKTTHLMVDLAVLIFVAFIFGLLLLIGRFFYLDDYSKTTSSLLFLIYALLILLIDFF